MHAEKQIAVLGGGCFWCIEAVFQQLKGVLSVEPGYAGGHTENPSYEQVSTGQTGHAEVAHIEFDPTTLNRQGSDVGTQYRSIIFTLSNDQKRIAEEYIKAMETSHEYGRPLVTEIKPLEEYYRAEDYHKNYYNEHKDQSYCQLVITPKVKKIQERFKEDVVISP